MYYAYIIENTKQQKYYVGITNKPKERWQRHQSNARSTSTERKYHTYLYQAMRKHGIENFTFELLKTFTTQAACEQFEIATILWFEDAGVANYNIHEGGTLGCNMQKHPNYSNWKQKLSANAIGNSKNLSARNAWIIKLKERRKGRTPALGMHHTEEAKQYASEVSNNYWDTQETFTRDADKVAAILALSHKQAKIEFGISTTHYYRLKKRFAPNVSK